MTCRQPSSSLLSPPSVCVLISTYKDSSHKRLGPTHRTSVYLNCLFFFKSLFVGLFLAALCLPLHRRATLVSVCRILLVAERGLWDVQASAVVARGFWSTGSVVVFQGLSCLMVCGIFPKQGLNLCPLHWQADS